MPLSWKDRNICLTFHAGKLSQGDFMRLGTAGLVFLLDCSSFCCNFLLFFFFFLMGLEQMLQFSVIENMTQCKGFHQEGEQTWGPLLCGGFQAFWSIQVIYGLSRWKPVPVLVTLALVDENGQKTPESTTRCLAVPASRSCIEQPLPVPMGRVSLQSISLLYLSHLILCFFTLKHPGTNPSKLLQMPELPLRKCRILMQKGKRKGFFNCLTLQCLKHAAGMSYAD